MQFKPSKTFIGRLVHPKDKTLRHKQSNVVYAMQCQEECIKLYIGKTKQPIYKQMCQHRCATSSGQTSAGHLQLKDSGHPSEDSQVRVLEREDCWYERGIKNTIHIKLKKPSLNRGGGQRHFLSPTYNVVFHSLGQQCKHSHSLMRPDDSPSCDPTKANPANDSQENHPNH